MDKLSPFLWFDKEAGEAANLYVSTFKGSKITNRTHLYDTPSGTVEIIRTKLFGQDFGLMSAGPLFKFTPAISFLIACDSKKEVDTLWGKLSEGGSVMMPLGEYPFSPWYGWTQDRFGLSWQIMHKGKMKIRQKITPTLMFVGKRCGKAEEAINFYSSVFKHSNIEHLLRHGKGESPDKEGSVLHAGFTLEKQDFAAMDSAHDHKFSFNEAVSLVVNCKTQKEIDYYWDKLSADPEAEQCGWLKDKYGVSWQITPSDLAKMQKGDDKKRIARVTKAFLKMKKFDLVKIKKAYEGK
jgi:predicted 3-demethylubiquinone-9 3-methyltransferase (glyoxalase superfamily)